MGVTFSPAVLAGHQHSWWKVNLIFILSGAIGGGVVGCAASIIGVVFQQYLPWRIEQASIYASIGFVAMGYALCEIGLLKMPICAINRQVPAVYRNTYPMPLVALYYGLQLGMGFTTRVTSTSLYVILLYIIVSGNIVSGAFLMSCYGMMRNLFSSFVGMRTKTNNDIDNRFGRMEGLGLHFRMIVSSMLMAFGVYLVVARLSL